MPTESTSSGFLAYAIRSLSDADFASKTLTHKPKTGFQVRGHRKTSESPSDSWQPLITRHEIIANAVWRFLQLRDYVNSKHELTAWGKALAITLTACGPFKEQEEAAFVAIELLRLGLLNASPMFLNYSGSPLRGTGQWK